MSLFSNSNAMSCCVSHVGHRTMLRLVLRHRHDCWGVPSSLIEPCCNSSVEAVNTAVFKGESCRLTKLLDIFVELVDSNRLAGEPRARSRNFSTRSQVETRMLRAKRKVLFDGHNWAVVWALCILPDLPCPTLFIQVINTTTMVLIWLSFNEEEFPIGFWILYELELVHLKVVVFQHPSSSVKSQKDKSAQNQTTRS